MSRGGPVLNEGVARGDPAVQFACPYEEGSWRRRQEKKRGDESGEVRVT